MDAHFLDYYNRELAYLREMGSEFAAAFPNVAGRLGMQGAMVADPYVERLLEGGLFAFCIFLNFEEVLCVHQKGNSGT